MRTSLGAITVSTPAPTRLAPVCLSLGPLAPSTVLQITYSSTRVIVH